MAKGPRKADAPANRLDVWTDASTAAQHEGIGIYVPSTNIKMAEGLVRGAAMAKANSPVNWAELSAVKRALQEFGPDYWLRIYSDSQWATNMAMGKWKPKKYKALVLEVRKLVLKHDAIVVWRRRELNAFADGLATWASGYRESV